MPYVPSLRGAAVGRRGQTRRQEEDAHGVLSEPGVPTRVHVRHEALPEQLGAGLPRFQPSTHRDAGQNVVSEPQEQMETSALGRTGGGQHGARLGTDTRGDAAGF